MLQYIFEVLQKFIKLKGWDLLVKNNVIYESYKTLTCLLQVEE